MAHDMARASSFGSGGTTNSSRAAPHPSQSLNGFLATDTSFSRSLEEGSLRMTSDSVARAGGVINSRSSVHRPPKPSSTQASAAPQHTDLQILGMYKNMRRAEAQGATPFSEDGAAAGAAAEDMIRGEPQRPAMGGFDEWCDRTEVEIRRRQRGGGGATGIPTGIPLTEQ